MVLELGRSLNFGEFSIKNEVKKMMRMNMTTMVIGGLILFMIFRNKE